MRCVGIGGGFVVVHGLWRQEIRHCGTVHHGYFHRHTSEKCGEFCPNSFTMVPKGLFPQRAIRADLLVTLFVGH